MRKKRQLRFGVGVNRTSIKKLFSLFIIGIMGLFIFTGILTSFEPGHGLASNQIHEWSSTIKGEHFLYLLGMENHHFHSVLPDDSEPPSISSVLFEIATSITPNDPRSLLGRELPGFALFDGSILIAGEGTDYTNIPVESAPPMDVILAEREATQESLERLEQLEREREEIEESTDGRKVVHIIHSHNTESFLPELETNEPNEAFHNKVNITLVGEKLSQELEKRGIGTEVEERDIQENLREKGWNYPQSYDASRNFVEEAMQENSDLQYFFDIHRDSLPRDRTTVTINNEEFARTVFVIGGNHENYEENYQLAKSLHNELEEHYPGLSRGVILKDGPYTNGRFNQDLSSNSVLIEFGGVENTLEETYRAAEAVAEVFAEFYWDHHAVDG
ncbi:stage II sporulation protein P [Halalkalibacter hemicellulosilyticus]|uniref:Stage II sporulation protein P n=1 Tax=Halalkalibacter hemicellulosilyticusJCM 9152 TaxID=1236971 RepID=W4QK00_9BACI|nr:stage II sporulation protein P [Halalkalibacter hemicellulosilyticus]GAE31684.1 stage II sporulation protein P [Halalkalibacter hemicellulosilyticusJCM 9152]